MGQVLHGSARTTAAVHRAIQHSQTSLRALAKRHVINPKTVAKWRARTNTADQRPGPKAPHSTVLSIEEEAIIIAFRRAADLGVIAGGVARRLASVLHQARSGGSRKSGSILSVPHRNRWPFGGKLVAPLPGSPPRRSRCRSGRPVAHRHLC